MCPQFVSFVAWQLYFIHAADKHLYLSLFKSIQADNEPWKGYTSHYIFFKNQKKLHFCQL